MDLALTLDYEVFGDGSGDVFETMIHPTNKFLDICDRFGAQSTIFFEVAEYWAFKEARAKGIDLGYKEDPVKAIESQIVSAFKRGHDIQLHIHPQWLKAEYVDEDWELDNDYWRLPSVPIAPDSNFPIGLKELLARGKQTIEDLLKPIDKNYQCNIYRAGSFNIVPSEKIVQVLNELGFVADSSVYPGGKELTSFANYDFTGLDVNNPYWFVEKDVTKTSSVNTGFVEIPIFALMQKRFHRYSFRRILMARKGGKNKARKMKERMGNKSLISKFMYFFEKEAILWDFNLFSYGKLKRFLKKAAKIAEGSSEAYHPFILIGHSKNFYSFNEFQKFIRHASKRNDFITMTSIVNKIEKQIQ